MGWIAGVDGCKAGWVAVFRRLDDPAAARVEVFGTFLDIIHSQPDLRAVAIDMPIGLPDHIEGPGRAAEQAVRPLLGERQSSVFSIPARAAVEARTYDEACFLSAAASSPPRKVAMQGFMLFPKIREIDTALRADAALAARVVETHPEVIFRMLGGQPLTHTKTSPMGASERLAILKSAAFPEALLATRPPRGAKLDDFLDALACSHTAMRFAEGIAKPHPDPFKRDSFGLPIAIWT